MTDQSKTTKHSDNVFQDGPPMNSIIPDPILGARIANLTDFDSRTTIRHMAEIMAQNLDVHVARAEKTIRYLLSRGLIQLKEQAPMTKTTDPVFAALSADTGQTPEGIQYVLIRGLSAMGFQQPIQEAYALMQAALKIAGVKIV